MITIGNVRGLKKMLHVPTLKLFALNEIPLNNKDNRKNLKVFLILLIGMDCILVK
jgi:hypothetical protein